MKPVVVTTDKRGVFFGYLNGEIDEDNQRLTLHDGRNCIYWSSDVHGFLGLAGNGPTPGCRVGPKVCELRLFGVTSVAKCSDAAVEAWESEPWT